jgi:leucyl aminopeptidase
MKKDMGGAANVLGLADLVMGGRLDVRLRVLVPAVENAISGNAFRPGDVLRSRKGFTVEIGNTDAEGRLVLADALALGDEEAPQMMIDMATLTGAARVALGPDLPPFFTDDEALATDLAKAGVRLADPVWRLPLWKEYDSRYSSKVADFNNVNTDGFAGAITAALFLRRFVDNASTWAHFDIYGWNPLERPHAPVGGEAQAIRAIEDVLFRRFAG